MNLWEEHCEDVRWMELAYGSVRWLSNRRRRNFGFYCQSHSCLTSKSSRVTQLMLRLDKLTDASLLPTCQYLCLSDK